MIFKKFIRFEKYLTENRFIKVHSLWGDSGTGKTRSIYEKHPPEEICRVTHYPSRGNVQFDAYKGQSVLVFEEFHHQGNLGHATAAFTLDVYGHVTNQMQEASAIRMEAYIKGILEL